MLLAWFKTRHILLFGFRIRFSTFISLCLSHLKHLSLLPWKYCRHFSRYQIRNSTYLLCIGCQFVWHSLLFNLPLFLCDECVCVSLMVDICPTVLAVNWTAFPPRDIRFSIIHLHYGFSFSFLLFACIFRYVIIFNNYFLQLISLGGNIAIKQRTFK